MTLATGRSRSLGGWLRRNWGVIASFLLVGFLFVYPFLMLVASAFRTDTPGREGSWSLAPFLNAYTDPRTYETLRNSLFYAISKQTIVLVVAVLLAIIATRIKHPLAKLITPMAVVVFVMPGLFFAMSWAIFTNPEIGPLNKFLDYIGMPSFTAESWPGLIGVTALKSIAVEYLLLLGPFTAMNRSLEEASLVSGSSRMRTVFRINLPVLAPAITAVAIIGFSNVMGRLEAPLVLGLPAGIDVFASRIYGYINAEYPAQYGEASALSLLLVALVLFLVWVQRKVLAERSYETITGKAAAAGRWTLGRLGNILVTALISVYGLLALVLPLGQLVLASFQPFFGSYSGLSLNNYRELFSDSAIYQTILNSIVVGIVGGFVAMLIASAFAYASTRRFRYARAMNTVTWIPYALPGLLLGLAMLWAYISVPGLRGLYATIWIVMIGLIVNTVPLTNRVAGSALEQVAPSLEEAARVSGSTRLRALRTTIIPLIAPSFLAGWLVAANMMIGNLDVPILMSSPRNQTIAVQVFRFYTAGQTTKAAALFCVLIVLMLVLITVTLLVTRLFRSRSQGAGSWLSAVTSAGPDAPAIHTFDDEPLLATERSG